MRGIYDKIYVIGHGAPPLACMKLLKKCRIAATFFETGGTFIDFSRRAAEEGGFAFEPITRNDLPDLFDQTHRTLVLSVNNSLIFPPQIVEMENLRILNYHNSLLPAHRGMHAEAWTIFGGDMKTGISWHVVDNGIDTGPIVAQRSMPVGKLTSIELLRQQCGLAVAALSESLREILFDTARPTPQGPCDGQTHKRDEKPNDGVLDLSWDANKIWGFMRAFDYGTLEMLGRPRCKINGTWYSWQSYTPLGADSPGPNDFILQSATLILKHLYQQDAEK